jgi:hypothetical protein
MNYKVNGFNNFCRVFQLPQSYPKGYCFGDGLPTTFVMVDWFNPVIDLPQWAISEKQYQELISKGELVDNGDHSKEINSDELQKTLTEFLRPKNYVKEENIYLVICNFGMSFTFSKSSIA